MLVDDGKQARSKRSLHFTDELKCLHACRLKQATVMRQDDEEDSMCWHVEAEVRS